VKWHTDIRARLIPTDVVDTDSDNGTDADGIYLFSINTHLLIVPDH